MCPDKQLLSVYLDGELPSPWKEKMAAHLTVCPECASLMKKFTLYSALLRQSPSVAEEAEQRVWRNIFENCSTLKKTRHTFWVRTIMLPLPVAVATIFVMLAVFAFALVRPSPPSKEPSLVEVSNPIDVDVNNIVPASDMGAVFQILGAQDASDFMIIKLPEDSEFGGSGEPAILKAVDYLRRIDSR